MKTAAKVAAAWAGSSLAIIAGAAVVLLYLGAGGPDADDEAILDLSAEDAKKVQALVDKKLRLRERAREKTPEQEARKQQRANDLGLPAGQLLARKWIVLDLGYRPTQVQYPEIAGAVDEARWSLKIAFDHGDENTKSKSLTLTLADLRPLAQTFGDVTWNCVTGWSTKGLCFKGVPMQELVEFIREKATQEHGSKVWHEDWRWLFQSSPEGYTVPAYREDVMDGGFLAIADGNGDPLSIEHGGIRFVFPTLYGWKSCKWVSELAFLPKYRKGWWERVACHSRGRVAFDERWAKDAGAFWTLLSSCNMFYLRVFGDTFAPVMQISGQILARIVDFLKASLRLHNDQ
ncbi:Hypothetical Protein FCC1311_097092 [Hondaea fermentalgiana]|uniref:Oxidoreductase molybdopterin-binding domain-containing protein n=1 Tax=Hondaea fermentalgiana TaxID=2315210 RepID=A0A2R5GRH4_9STRA|nr:Hypothetical Protein FCC1311_097092 [Hondaea fermentalgiana]|eukprot:GBG33486.1 Hypothetical Protein FCC1311_097092 [Hondaea fermentalgiana]